MRGHRVSGNHPLPAARAPYGDRKPARLGRGDHLSVETVLRCRRGIAILTAVQARLLLSDWRRRGGPGLSSRVSSFQGHAAPPPSSSRRSFTVARRRRACADFSARRFMCALRACSARRARSAGVSFPSGSTCRSNLSSMALRAAEVLAARSGVRAHESWAAICARITRSDGVKDDTASHLNGYQPPCARAAREAGAGVALLRDTEPAR